jgi:hypothetical protein
MGLDWLVIAKKCFWHRDKELPAILAAAGIVPKDEYAVVTVRYVAGNLRGCWELFHRAVKAGWADEDEEKSVERRVLERLRTRCRLRLANPEAKVLRGVPQEEIETAAKVLDEVLDNKSIADWDFLTSASW